MSAVITINDKQFKPYISQYEILKAVQKIAGDINSDLKQEMPVFLVVLNGAFMFASDLLKEISIPCEMCFIKVSSYVDTVSSGEVTELIGITNNLAGRTVVVVEDIVDTGLTIRKLVLNLKEKQVKQIKIASAFMKPDAYKENHHIDYVGIKIKNEFVVGYGLDYNGFGRNLKEVYVLV